MRRFVLVLCLFAHLCSVESVEIYLPLANMCGNVTYFTSQKGNCEEDYNNSDISHLFGSLTTGDPCDFFLANFSNVPVNTWTNDFISCKSYTHSPLSYFSTNNFPLQTADCFKNNSLTMDGDCDCRMDCLLEFNAPGSPSRQLFYIQGIGCIENDLTTNLKSFSNSSNVYPNIQMKQDYLNCPAQSGHDPSSTIVPYLSSSQIFTTTDQPSSDLTTMIIPTSTPPSCMNYNIQQFSANGSYCTICHSDSGSPFRESVNSACQFPNQSNWYFKPVSNAATFQSFKQCAIDSNTVNINQLFDLSNPCQSNKWIINKVYCECPHENGCFDQTLSSSPDISNCVLKFIRHDQPNISSLVFTSGWDTLERDNIMQYLSSCSVEIVNNCTTTLPESSVPVTSQSNESIFESLYIRVAIGVVGGALILLILSIVMMLIVIMKRKKRSSDYYTTGNKLYEATQGNISPQTITSDNLSPINTTAFNWGNKTHGNQQCVQIPKAQYSKWKRIFSRQVVEASQIEVMETIGEGAFGLVQKGEMRGRNDRCIQVAIKAMKEASTPEQVEEFVSESAIMLDFDHPNVLALLGVCFDTDNGLPLIVLPYMANGDLKTYLQIQRHGTPRGNIPDGLSITLLMRMCLDIAKGMAYLARTKFVHRDLAARNCMVDENLIVRVADFGLSRDVYSKDYYRLERRVKLPVKWLPPESLHDSIFTERTDVWSFGVTCWEVFSLGRTPYPSIDNADVLDYIEKGFRLKKVPLCPKEVYLLLSQCWDESPEIRPCFLIIVQSLKTILTNWEVHDSTLKKQMEVELQMSLDQDGYESDSQELDGSGSMAARIGSRARYPPKNSVPEKNPHRHRFSSSSSVGMSTINSRTALISTGTSRDESSPVAVRKPSNVSIHLSDNECYGTELHVYHKYMNFTPGIDHQHCDCCGSINSLDKCGEKDNHVMPPNVPMFEMFYNDTSQLSKTAPKSNSIPAQVVPNDLEVHARDLEISQSSCGTEITNLADTPIDPDSYKTIGMEPMNYSLPVRTTPQPPLSNGVHRKEGGLQFCSRGSSKSSATPSTSSNSHDRTVTVSSPTNHFYFTLDPNNSSPSVFDSDTSNSQSSNCDTPKSSTIRKTSCSLEMENPVFAYQTYSSLESSRTQKSFPPTILPSEELSDDDVAINSTTPHRHIVLDHYSLQKFDSELTL